ncbi:MAG: hypothetical protein ACKOW8_09550 [Flavobacteriales bacterium]
MILCVSSVTFLGQSDKSGKGPGGESALMVTRLPVSVTKNVLQSFNLNDFPMLCVSLVNSHVMEVAGLPKEKLDVLLSGYFADYQNRMSTEDYLKYVLPGPGISGDEKLDTERYYNVLKQFRLRFPETAWYQPKEVVPLLTSLEGAAQLMKMQVAGNHSLLLLASDPPLPTQVDLPVSNDKVSTD